MGWADISHDRAFLDALTQRTCVIEEGGHVQLYEAPITQALQLREQHRESLRAQREALRRYGVESVCSLSASWTNKKSCWLIGIEHSVSGEIVAGIRLEAEPPFLCASAHPQIARFMDGADALTGEMCGAWARSSAPRGVGPTLYRAVLDLARRLELGRVVALASSHTRDALIALGFEAVEQVCGGRGFVYPDERYLSIFTCWHHESWRPALCSPKEDSWSG